MPLIFIKALWNYYCIYCIGMYTSLVSWKHASYDPNYVIPGRNSRVLGWSQRERKDLLTLSDFIMP